MGFYLFGTHSMMIVCCISTLERACEKHGAAITENERDLGENRIKLLLV